MQGLGYVLARPLVAELAARSKDKDLGTFSKSLLPQPRGCGSSPGSRLASPHPEYCEI